MGLDYQPIILESVGGFAPEAINTLSSINRLVADNTDTPIQEVAGRFWQRVSMDLQRANHRAFRRRNGQRDDVFSGGGFRWVRAVGCLVGPEGG